MRATTKQRLSDWIIPIYRRLQVLKINDLYKLKTAKFMHQFSDKSLPAYLKNILLAQLSFTVTPLEHLSAMIIFYRIILHLVYNAR